MDVFCQIAAAQIPSDILYSDEEVMAFRDINPQAPVHILIMPRRHIATLADLKDEDAPLVARMVLVANEMARREGILEKGYRIVVNSGREGGQLVPHLHMHLLGGRRLAGGLG
ncbi:MAG: histidine triad nucleotide-binding protein [Chloroflexi bacterium]|nr:histidine triad nucleotide-binding protein [Chloroflexota bacterium]